nr:alkaline phosphatase D family protein [Kofleriaceae bacterium]
MFEPDSNAFLVSVWSARGSRATVEVTAGGDEVAVIDVAIDAAGQGVVDVTGLVADVAYDVTIALDTGARLGPHRVRTAPADDATRPVRLAVSADWDPSNPEFDSDLVAHVVAAEPELYVSIGDFPYTDNGPIAQTVALYRERHAALRADPRARALHEAMGVRAIYDDHEFRNNWDAHFAAIEPARYASAMQVWDEFFPLRDAAPGVRYRKWRWGANVECFLLDCRRFRSADAAVDDAGKTMLGKPQLAWLLDGLARSTATFKLVFTSIPLDYGVGDDHWAAFTTERQVIFDALLANQTPGVLFVSGDQHWFAAQQHAYGLREFQIGPVARGFGVPPDPQPAGVLFRAVRFNVGLVDVDGDSLTFTGLGDDGTRFYSETVTAQQLTAK